jgi:hypothetical protein
VVEPCFCRGFGGNAVAECGFWMVNSWWNAGERWSEDGLKLPAIIFHFSRIYFLGFPVLGIESAWVMAWLVIIQESLF